jgi:hypothetical protein
MPPEAGPFEIARRLSAIRYLIGLSRGFGRTSDHKRIDILIQLNAESAICRPSDPAGEGRPRWQADSNGFARQQIKVAFPANAMGRHVTHEDIDPSQTGVKHMRFEQPTLTRIRTLLFDSGILIGLHWAICARDQFILD